MKEEFKFHKYVFFVHSINKQWILDKLKMGECKIDPTLSYTRWVPLQTRHFFTTMSSYHYYESGQIFIFSCWQVKRGSIAPKTHYIWIPYSKVVKALSSFLVLDVLRLFFLHRCILILEMCIKERNIWIPYRKVMKAPSFFGRCSTIVSST